MPTDDKSIAEASTWIYNQLTLKSGFKREWHEMGAKTEDEVSKFLMLIHSDKYDVSLVFYLYSRLQVLSTYYSVSIVVKYFS